MSTDSDAGFRPLNFVSEQLDPALDLFEESLNRRWRAEVVDYIYKCNEMSGYVLPGTEDPAPDHDGRWASQIKTHTRGTGSLIGSSNSDPDEFCTYVRWVKNGQEGSLSDVSDHGPPGGGFGDIRNTDDPSDFEYDSCPIGNQVFREIEELARRERGNLLPKIPLFDAHDLGEIEQSHGSLVKLCAILGLDLDNSVGLTGHSNLTGITSNDLQKWNGAGTNIGWWANWTGLVPGILAGGSDSDAFFQSTTPTLHYHAQIAGSLANLLNVRATIVLNTRKNVVNAVTSAAGRLDQFEFQDTTSESSSIFAVVAAGSLLLALYPPAGVAAASLSIAAFLGDGMMDKASSDLAYQQSREGIIADLHAEVDQINDILYDDELKYTSFVATLESDILGLKASHRALYDFTQNNPRGAKGAKGFEIDPEHTLEIARHCFRAAEEYESTISALVGSDPADAHLRNADGVQTWADAQVAEIREVLLGYLRTTIARYHEAGLQTKDGIDRTYRTDRAIADNWAAYEAQLEAGQARERKGGENPYSPDKPDFNGSEEGTGGRSDQQVEQPDDQQLAPDVVNPGRN
ncbi:hypothetical protein SAMN05192558_107103 [Actinokineospora alba]|uniref:Uncharacterized protein n=1 Tax=Actinokineospora alba TaxID=504798 RepID=A0A1H0QQI4_9PSEU|nr:hypothetical protein [Actinokineospora alba]TDP70438.1 hypothetical protein C8E96_6048 [Actinokineospora alba]SDI31601.1 hypothetical protein SAMN05421871_104102 [Actinokineospora alba]SDP19617.1 hypothetical protein SAMN05192558_107103 [Actinokineospora alba]